MPFSDTIDLITLSGSTLRETFEYATSKLTVDGQGDAGAFLQVSGKAKFKWRVFEKSICLAFF